MWYDTNLNLIEPPNDDDNNTYIFIQKPHTRTLRFYIIGKIIEKRFEFPWMVFCYKSGRLLISISKEMPTLDSQLYEVSFLGFSVCVHKISYFYEKPTPQDYIDYFWQSSFSVYPDTIDIFQNYLKNPSKYNPSICSNIKKLIYYIETGLIQRY